MQCVVVVPTYNEAANITETLNRLLGATVSGAKDPRSGPPGDQVGPRVAVLVVDDSSPDGTADLVRAHPLFPDRIHLLTRATRDGLGAAYRAGFARALNEGYDVVVQMDADGSHPVDQVFAMVALLESHDVVVGSRYSEGGRTRNWPWRRRALSRAANLYARSLLGLRTRDSTSGFRAWRTTALTTAGVLDTRSSGYAFQIENTWRTERAGLRITEHPITFTDRTAGTSKMTTDVALEAARLVPAWRIHELRIMLRRRTIGSPGSRRTLTVRR